MTDNLLSKTLQDAVARGAGPRAQSRADFVYQALRLVIQAGQLAGGDRVREEEIAGILGVSRTPVREALRRLQSNGLLEIASGRGFSIPLIGRQQVLELFDMRRVLEGAAARFAAQHASESEIGMLFAFLDRSLGVIDDPAATTALNRFFHQGIYDAAHNRYLLGSLREIYDSMALLGTTTYTIPGRSHDAHAEHVRIVEAITARKPDKAEQAAQKHIDMARRARLEVLARV